MLRVILFSSILSLILTTDKFISFGHNFNQNRRSQLEAMYKCCGCVHIIRLRSHFYQFFQFLKFLLSGVVLLRDAPLPFHFPLDKSSFNPCLIASVREMLCSAQ